MKNDRDLLDLLYELARVVRYCHQEEICGEGITFVQFNILNSVFEAGTLSLSDLHAALMVDRSTTTRLVAPLVKKGLVERCKSSEDSRAVNLTITDAGIQARNRAWSCLQAFIGEIMANIPESELSGVFKSMGLLARSVKAAREGDGCCQPSPGQA